MSGWALVGVGFAGLLVGGGLSWVANWFEDRQRDRHFTNPKTGRFYKDE